MLTLAPFTFCANNVPGTDPIRAMDMARRCGFHTIELSAIDGISEQIVTERVSPEYVMQIERELQKRDLQCTALSAHCDMTDEAQFARLLKKIEFAGQIGAQLVNTRCGPKARYAVFEEHVKRAAAMACGWGWNPTAISSARQANAAACSRSWICRTSNIPMTREIPTASAGARSGWTRICRTPPCRSRICT